MDRFDQVSGIYILIELRGNYNIMICIYILYNNLKYVIALNIYKIASYIFEIKLVYI